MAVEKKEEKKISPAIILIPIGFGAALAGVAVIAALAKAAPGTANLHGTVTDVSTGSPIPGVLIIVDSSQATSDASGNFSFTGLSTGSHHCSAQKDGYQTVSEDITLVAGDNIVNIQMTSTGVTPTTATLYGKVTDAQTGAPLEGVKVTIDSLTASTDVNGNYTFYGLNPGSYTVTFEKEGYETVTK